MIFPEKTDAPALGVIVTLWGMSASRSANAILNGTPAGALRATGENSKSFASSARIRGGGVARGVGLGVGLGVGRAVGFALGSAVGFAVGEAVGLIDADAISEGVTTGSRLAGEAVGGAVEGAELGAGVSDGEADGTVEAVGTWATSFGSDVAVDRGVAKPTVDPPQAATSRLTAITCGSRARDTAAL